MAGRRTDAKMLRVDFKAPADVVKMLDALVRGRDAVLKWNDEPASSDRSKVLRELVRAAHGAMKESGEYKP